ncbi:MAG: NAD(P)H-dependent oxidoreductase [Gammaproteobacteria bacterium]
MPGSLRKRSFNRMLCEAAAEAAPDDVEIGIFDDVTSISPFNEDVEAATGYGPEPVRALRRRVAAADGLLLATPEYNQSVPGVLKNMLDWLSRPGPEEVLAGKPVAVIGASSGPWGTRLAQKGLRHILNATESLVLPGQAMFVRNAAD